MRDVLRDDGDTGKVRYSRAINEHCDIRLGWDIENRDEGVGGDGTDSTLRGVAGGLK
jgi:hypothetical protein